MKRIAAIIIGLALSASALSLMTKSKAVQNSEGGYVWKLSGDSVWVDSSNSKTGDTTWVHKGTVDTSGTVRIRDYSGATGYQVKIEKESASDADSATFLLETEVYSRFFDEWVPSANITTTGDYTVDSARVWTYASGNRQHRETFLPIAEQVRFLVKKATATHPNDTIWVTVGLEAK